MLDQIERWEAAAEEWADEHIHGDNFDCPGCGVLTPLDQGETLSPNPYAQPFCRKCVVKAQEQRDA